MNSTRLCLIVAFAAALCPSAWAADSDAVRDAIQAANRIFIASVLHGDSQAVASLYSADGVVIAPGAEPAKGRAAIAALWQKSIDAGVKGMSLVTDEVVASDDLAAETGTAQIIAADGKVENLHYVVVWRKEEGHWRLLRDIWN
jgi:uncharacterized protein (TIGR02246 family)